VEAVLTANAAKHPRANGKWMKDSDVHSEIQGKEKLVASDPIDW